MAGSNISRRRVRIIASMLGSAALVAGITVATAAGGARVSRQDSGVSGQGVYTVTLTYPDSGVSPLVFQASGFALSGSTTSLSSQSTGAAGISFSTFTITRSVDAMTPSILSAFKSGQGFTTATVTNTRAVAGTTTFTITLSPVRITSIAWDAAANGAPQESLSLKFIQITWA